MKGSGFLPIQEGLEVEGVLRPDLLLSVLNQNSGDFIQRYVKQEGLLDELQEMAAHTEDGRLRALVSAAVAVTTQLRSYVSEWIDTGREPEGRESPHKRDLEAAPEAIQAAHHFLDAYPIKVEIVDLGKSSQKARYDVGCLSLFEGERSLPHEPQEAALAWATSFFVALLLSPWRNRVCQCRNCEKFFMLPRAPLAKGYGHGIYCPKCSSRASAVASTRDRREDTREVFAEFAAEATLKLRIECSAAFIKEHAQQIADKVTSMVQRFPGKTYRGKRIGKRACSRKWVATYASEIARRASEIAKTQRDQQKRAHEKDAVARRIAQNRRENARTQRILSGSRGSRTDPKPRK